MFTGGGSGINSGNGGGNALEGKSPAEQRLALWWRLIVRFALIGLTVYFLWRVRSILTTLVVALVIACAASALVEPLCRRRIRWLKPHTQRLIATTIVFAGMVGGIIWAGQLFLGPFNTEFRKLADNFPTYQQTLTDKIAQAQDWYNKLPPDLRHFVDDQKTKLPIPSPGAYVAGVLGATFAWASHIVELILVPVLAFYFTLDSRKLRNEFLFLVPRDKLRTFLAIISQGSAIMRAYIISQFWLAVIAGVVVGVALKWLGMDYALVLGILAGFTRAIPVIGPLLGGAPIVLLSFVYGAQHGDPYLWIKVLTFFTLMHLIESKIIMPRFLGHALNLHAVIIIVALLVGGEFFGLMGMFLAAPIAALLRLLITHYVIEPRRRVPSPRPVLTLAGTGGRTLRLERTTPQPASSHLSPQSKE